jgi:hypothetical protein
MPRRAKTGDPSQLSLFDLIERQRSMAGELRAALTADLTACAFPRDQVAARMGVLTGSPITKAQLDGFTAPTKDNYRFPAEYLPAFCQATGEFGALERLAEAAGCVLVVPGQVRARLAEVERQRRELADEERALKAVQRSVGRVIDGPLPMVTGLKPDGLNDAHVDLLDNTGKYITARTIVGLPGVFVTNGRMKVAETSDFRWVEWRRVMDKACREVRLAALKSLQQEATPGGIEALKSDLQQPLNIMRGAGEIADGKVTIPDNQDFIATQTVKVKVRVQPIAAMRFIDVELGFDNPFRS